jgi:phosphatidylserine/phosphatidylglycerophosphate/cardiolipin synthase-like enzyme
MRRLLPLLLLLLTGCSAAPVASITGQLAPQVATVQSTKVTSYFTQADEHPETALIAVMDGAKQSLDVAIYSLTKAEIVKAMLNAHKRGVTVRVMTDKIQAAGKSQTVALRTLMDAGIPVKQNTHSGLMHLKVTIADKAIVTTGSYNYSAAATTTNDEVLVVMPDPAMAKSWAQQFQRMWDDKANYAALK